MKHLHFVVLLLTSFFFSITASAAVVYPVNGDNFLFHEGDTLGAFPVDVQNSDTFSFALGLTSALAEVSLIIQMPGIYDGVLKWTLWGLSENTFAEGDLSAGESIVFSVFGEATATLGSPTYVVFSFTSDSAVVNEVPSGSVPTIPVPPAVWLFGSGLIGLVGIARREPVIA